MLTNADFFPFPPVTVLCYRLSGLQFRFLWILRRHIGRRTRVFCELNGVAPSITYLTTFSMKGKRQLLRRFAGRRKHRPSFPIRPLGSPS